MENPGRSAKKLWRTESDAAGLLTRGAFSALRPVADLFFPLFCLSCRARLVSSFSFGFCRPCFRRAGLIRGSACARCGRPLPASSWSGLRLCGQCRDTDDHIDLCFSALAYTGPVRAALAACKYRGKEHHGYYFGRLMAAFLKARMGPGEAGGLLIVPVPLHRAREKERGFNQSELLARHLTSALGLEPPVTALTRRAQAVSQTSLSRTERLKNIRDNFAVTGGKMVRGRTVLLIDDVLTTGATMSECARVLKQAGAKKVMGFTLASVALMP